jgi:FkbM family methyltransferase
VGAVRNAWKHWFRRQAVAHAPMLYWRARSALRGYEEPELGWLPRLCRRDSTVVDVGANFGMYTYWLSSLADRCVAFEPIPKLAAALARGFGSRIELHNVALSDADGVAELTVPNVSPGLSSIEPRNRITADPTAVRYTVPKRRLDDFELGDVSFVKIDVEGHEEAVLRGAARLLAAQRPTLLLELEDRHSPGCVERVAAMLLAQGFAGGAIANGELLPLDALAGVVGGYGAVRNYLFADPDRFAELRRSQ